MKHFSRISAQEFAQCPSPTVVDVRTSGEVAGIQLPGAINLPLQSITAEQVNTLCAPNDEVYLLCVMGKRAEMAAEKIASETQAKLIVIDGGIQALEQAGIELARSARKIISIERQVQIIAGLLILSGILLGSFVTPAFYGLAAFVGAGLTFAGITGTCAMGLLLARMPWNQAH